MDKTKITSHINEKIVQGQNLIYCSTMQLAWNELYDFLGGKIVLHNDAPATRLAVEELNKRKFKKEDLDPKCYIALAGLCGDGLVEKIKNMLQQNFNETSKCDFKNLGPTDIIAYAFLLKILTFEQKFEKIENLIFTTPFNPSDYVQNTPVEAFGIEEVKIDRECIKLTNQVEVLHYENPSEFTITLKTRQEEFITLARLTPGDTLQDTLSKMGKGTTTPLRKGEVLKIPKISFDLEHHFKELMGNTVWVSKDGSSEVNTDYYIDDAVQFIKFDLDENGAKLRSEAAITMRYMSIIRHDEEIRKFIFDGPFLILLRQTEDSPPYFVAWIENPEILKKK